MSGAARGPIQTVRIVVLDEQSELPVVDYRGIPRAVAERALDVLRPIIGVARAAASVKGQIETLVALADGANKRRAPRASRG